MSDRGSVRAEHEIAHGQKLAQANPELVWGWGSPAGKARARRRAELIVAGADLRPGVRALEIGCGTGLFTEIFAQKGAHLVAIDVSPHLIEIAQKRGLPKDRVQLREENFENCESDDPFDAVIGSSILHHLDLRSALPRIYRLLAPGGVVSFAEPNMLNPQILIQKNIPWIKERLGDSPDETAFVRWRLRALLLETGFVDVEIVPFDWLHPSTPPFLISMITRIGCRLERTPILREFAGCLYIRCRRPQMEQDMIDEPAISTSGAGEAVCRQ